MSVMTRFSDKELEEFKVNIEQKLEKTNKDLNFLLEQIEDITEVREGEHDVIDDASSSNDLELLLTMANRQRKHKQDLENALIRIKNKSYGVCILSGELIDKRRLIAVPTTTKTLKAKNAAISNEEKKIVSRTTVTKPTESRKVISKVIRKKINPVQNNFLDEEEEDFFFDDTLEETNIEETNIEETGIDFDSFPST